MLKCDIHILFIILCKSKKVLLASQLTVILLELKVTSLCHQYRARSACTSVHSDQDIYCWLTNFLSCHLDIPNYNYDSSAG